MKNYLMVAAFVLFNNLLAAQELYVHSIEFKGQSAGNRFNGQGFDINCEDGKFRVSLHNEKGEKFLFGREDNSVEDLVFSADRSAIGVAMHATNPKDRQRSIITIDASGMQRSYEYKAYNMTERWGWVVELASVSNNGIYVLAKCARMLPENEAGISYVRHEWTIIKISNNSIDIINSDDSINKWHEYVSK
jgi:hypothetical protein